MLRTIQIHTIAKSSVKQILRQLKETDEENKSIRTSLREILLKTRELKFVNGVKLDEIPVEDRERESSRDLSQISNIQRSNHVEGQIHTTPSKCESNISVRENRAYFLGDMASTLSTTSNAELTIREKSVNFKNILTKFIWKKQEKTLLYAKNDGFEENLTTTINTQNLFLRFLPESRKIKCKIKNKKLHYASDQRTFKMQVSQGTRIYQIKKFISLKPSRSKLHS